MPSFAPCLHEEADTWIFARATEAAKRLNKKISSYAVETDVVVLVIPVMQQLWVDELRVGKTRGLLLVWNQIFLLTGCNKTSFLFGRGKRWVSFPDVTGYFVKMNSLPEKPPTDYLCTMEWFITVLYGRTIKHLHVHEHRHGLITFVYQKGLIDGMTAFTKVALYQHRLKAANQGSCVRVSTRTGEMIAKSSKLWCLDLDTGMYSPPWTTILLPLSSLDLVIYGYLQGCRSRQCSSPVYDPLCLWWQLRTLHDCF